jgi:3-hydroxybutyryl-CoA dehydratase
MKLGDALPSISKVVIQEDIKTYADASGDQNPLHQDQAFAASTHFGRIVAHGMLVLAYVSEMMAQAFGQHWLETGGLKTRFRAPVYPGDRVATFGEVVNLVEENGDVHLTCFIGCRNEDGEEVVNGEAWVTMPNNNSKDVS